MLKIDGILQNAKNGRCENEKYDFERFPPHKWRKYLMSKQKTIIKIVRVLPHGLNYLARDS